MSTRFASGISRLVTSTSSRDTMSSSARSADGGRFATRDLNAVRRVSSQHRLSKLIELMRLNDWDEKRMLQEAVDALFDNGAAAACASANIARPILRTLKASRAVSADPLVLVDTRDVRFVWAALSASMRPS